MRASPPVKFLHDFLFPSQRARDTVSFGLDDILHTAASDSEDFGPALADALPPSGQEERPSAAYSELVDVLSRATEKLALDWEKVFLMDAPISQSGLFGEAVSAVVDKFRSAKTQSAALKQFMPRRSRDYSTPSLRKEPPSGGAQATRPSPTTVWGARGRSFSRQQPRKRVNLKRHNKPAASANPGRS